MIKIPQQAPADAPEGSAGIIADEAATEQRHRLSASTSAPAIQPTQPAPPDPQRLQNIWLNAFGNLLETLNHALNEGKADERGRYIIELRALATFVSTFSKPISAHIFELASKFSDLDNGRNHPVFLPADVGDRHTDYAHQWRSRARYVVAVEALVLTGTKPEVALKKIASECPKLPSFAGKKATKTPPERVLKNWRKEFQRGRESIDPARQATQHRAAAHLEGDQIFEEGVAWIKKRLLARDRKAILAIASNVDEAVAIGGVFSTSGSH